MRGRATLPQVKMSAVFLIGEKIHQSNRGSHLYIDSSKQIGSLAFSWAHTKGIIIQSDFSESSWGSAFTSMDKLEFIYIKDGCNPIFSSDAFYSCPSIQFAIIPASVTSLPDKIFEDAKKIKIITPAGSYAESFAMEHFLPVETESYADYVAQYDGLYPD